MVSSMDTLPPGTMVDQYEVTGILGRGGMGTVYSGVQPVIGKQVAIKVINREFSGNPEVVARFVQEARAVNQAHSRFIVDIFAFGVLADGCHYYIMEHVNGRALEEELQEHNGPLPLPQALAILRCVTSGLAAAHAMEIVHRDLKPGNILVLREEGGVSAKLLDFGIAKIMGEPGEAGPMTRTGAVFGTPAYMAPEQIRAQAVDQRTDIYALGVIMFQLFTGQLPFDAVAFIDLVNMHLSQPPPDPAALRPGLPTQLRDLILTCLQKDPANRPATVEEVAAALALPATAPTLPAVSATLPVGSLTPPAASPLAQAPHETLATDAPRRGWSLYSLLALIPALLVGGWFLFSTSPDPKPAPAPETQIPTPNPAPAPAPAPAPETRNPKPAPAPETRTPKPKPSIKKHKSQPDLGPPPPTPDLRPALRPDLPPPPPAKAAPKVKAPPPPAAEKNKAPYRPGPAPEPSPAPKPAKHEEEVPFGF